jgi:hypothetical protein
MRSPCCVWSPNHIWMPGPIFTKPDMYILLPQRHSSQIRPFNLCICKCISFIVARQRFPNSWTYVYNRNLAHLKEVLHKSLSLLGVSSRVPLLSLKRYVTVKRILQFYVRQRLCKNVPETTNKCTNLILLVVFFSCRWHIIINDVRIALSLSLYLCIVTGQFSNDVLAATKWLCIICFPCRNNRRQADSSCLVFGNPATLCVVCRDWWSRRRRENTEIIGRNDLIHLYSLDWKD